MVSCRGRCNPRPNHCPGQRDLRPTIVWLLRPFPKHCLAGAPYSQAFWPQPPTAAHCCLCRCTLQCLECKLAGCPCCVNSMHRVPVCVTSSGPTGAVLPYGLAVMLELGLIAKYMAKHFRYFRYTCFYTQHWLLLPQRYASLSNYDAATYAVLPGIT
jgi:hypothetical protein